MQNSDVIADMLTRIRNANAAKHESVTVPASNMKKAIAQILADEGYIKGLSCTDDGLQGILKINLKYGANKTRILQGIKRVSKPGLRIYTASDEIPKVLGGMGVAILSTSRGLMTDKRARRENIGGEVLAFVW